MGTFDRMASSLSASSPSPVKRQEDLLGPAAQPPTNEGVDGLFVFGRGQGVNVGPEDLISASTWGDAATIAAALRNPLTNPNMADDESGHTALMRAAQGVLDKLAET